jgi:hypothetical protein
MLGTSGAVMATPPPPTFLIIGAQKSATRWLRLKLGEHPQIFTARKELHYWNNRSRMESLGLAGYAELFVGWNGEPIVGESTPGYMMWRHDPFQVAQRVKRELPDARLLAILRNPVDRANSALLHHIRRGRLPAGSRLIDVVFHDDVVEEPEKPFEAALRHVGADPSFRPAQLAELVFSNKQRAPRRAPSLTPEDRAELWKFFSDDVEQLEEMLGCDLSRWRPSVQPADGRDD